MEEFGRPIYHLVGKDTSRNLLGLFLMVLHPACRPCHVLAIDHARQRIVLTIRGSLELGDLLTDLHAKPIAVQLPILDGEHAQCHVHEGMLRAAAYVHCNTADALVEASGRFPDWPLFVTGHSLGGGVAALVAVLLRQQGGAPERLQVHSLCYFLHA